MQIEEAKKILKGMFYNDNGEKMHYIDFSDSYGDEWGGYTLPEYIEAIETVLNELEKKDKVIDLLIKELYTKAHISTGCYLQTSTEECMKYKNCYECLKKHFEDKERSNDEKRN